MSNERTPASTPHGLPESRIEEIAAMTRNPNRAAVKKVLRIAAAEAFDAGSKATVSETNTRAKFIRCEWVPEKQWGYGKAMRVVESDHPRFQVGTRFDYGFLKVAIEHGFAVHIGAVSEAVQQAAKELMK